LGLPAYGPNDNRVCRPRSGISSGPAHVGARPSTDTAKWDSGWSRCLPGHRPAPQCRTSPGVFELRLDREARLLVEAANGLIPVELKSRNCPRSGPHEGEVAQVTAYCVLVEDALGATPPFGIIQYADLSWPIRYTLKDRKRLLHILDEMRRSPKLPDGPPRSSARGSLSRLRLPSRLRRGTRLRRMTVPRLPGVDQTMARCSGAVSGLSGADGDARSYRFCCRTFSSPRCGVDLAVDQHAPVYPPPGFSNSQATSCPCRASFAHFDAFAAFAPPIGALRSR